MPELVGPGELHVHAPSVEPVAYRGRRGKDLQGHGPLPFRVALRGYPQDIIGAQIHPHKLSAFDKTDAVRTGLESLSAYFERNFVKQISLVFLFGCRRVTGAVHESRENVKIVSEGHPATIA